ncbi:kinetochore-associated protein DSN1 homolog isoform X2 [Taeniopygia guttata]|uniref:kinetochore-associated protein DSN1 homolog isoform X2 n=1 Tax=Taeniopygia guttata TaxID=59729 RepID=UPI003BB87E3D
MLAAKPSRVPRMRLALRASERRESAMEETAAGAGGSPGPAAAPSPRGSAGPREDEPRSGGASTESRGAAPEPGSAALSKGTPGSSGRRRRRAAGSPGAAPGSFRLSPAVAAPRGPRGPRRSWRRSSLKGRRSRRRSLPPLHTGLSQSISLELPEVQRLSLLLLSSFQFSARKLQQVLEESEGFDPEAFAAKGIPWIRRWRNPWLSLSGELQAWDRLLQQHLQHSQEASRNLEQLRAGSPPGAPPPIPKNSQILASKPNYGAILTQQGPALPALRLLVDEAQQAGKMVLEFHEESRTFLRGLSEQLASRAFRQLQGSPARKLLQRRPQKVLPEEGE